MKEDIKVFGLQSIVSRLNDLEKVKDIKEEEEEENHLNKLITELKHKETVNKKNKFNDMLIHFDENINELVSTIDTDYQIEIIINVIKYVESNSQNISKNIGVNMCSEYKRELCISLFKHTLPSSVFTNEYLTNTINSIHKLLYYKPNLNEEEIELKKSVVVKPKKFKLF